MIKIKNFTMLRKIDFIAVFILAVLWAFTTTIANLPNTYLSFMLSLFITTVFASFIALLIRRAGAVILFYFIGAFITIPFNNLIEGHYKIFVLLMAGVIFELFVFFSRKKYLNNVPIGVVLAAGFSNSSIPWAMLLFAGFSEGILSSAINFSLSAFLVGVIGAITAFLIWYNIKGNKTIINFEYSV